MQFPTSESKLLLPSAAGHIEVLATPANQEPPKGTVLICHPHPLFGGTMHNKVVSTLARTFQNLGLRTVRFNFRGVGKSEGTHDNGKGETDDLVMLAEWVKESFPNDALWLAGFSFGAYVAAQGALRLPALQLVTIAPMVSRFKENNITFVAPCPWILVQGEQDEVVSPGEVFAWVEELDPKPTLIRMADAGHFFHGQLLELRRQLELALA